MSLILRGLASSLALLPAAAAAADSENIVVTASRAPEDLRTLPASVTVITQKDIAAIADAGQDLAYVLARLAPGMGPETNSVSNFGQQLQGRKVLILIDGIPQTENRQVSRQLNTIQLSSIQRIEIISGATAIYGADAIGGAINVITRSYSEAPIQQTSRISASTSEKSSFKESGAWQIEHQASGTVGNSQYLVNASLEKRAGTIDANGDLIPPEPAQTSRDHVQAIQALGKYNYRLSDDKSLELSVNIYQDKQDLEYGVALDPYRAEHGLELDDQPFSERQQIALRYQQKGFEATVYRRERTYRFFPFVLTSPFTIINQSTTESESLGARLQWDTAATGNLRLIYGVDYENELGKQKARSYDYTDYTIGKGLVYKTSSDFYDYGPSVRTEKTSPFLQTKWTINEDSHLHAGLRYEYIRQKIHDFTPPLETAISSNYTLVRFAVAQLEQANKLPAGTAASLPDSYEKAQFEGGEKTFDATAFNIGYSYNPVADQQLYINYAQGYELADTARLMRDAVAPGSLMPVVGQALGLDIKSTSVSKTKTATIYTQSVNTGWHRWGKDSTQSVNIFYNQSDKIYRFNRDFSVTLLNQVQEVHGLELSSDWRLMPEATVGGSYVQAWGRYHAEDGHWLRLSTAEVNPPKLALYGTWAITPSQTLRGQTTQVFSQRGSARAEVPRFRGYSVEDLMWVADLGAQNRLQFGINNLFNHDYKSVFHQWAEDTYGAASGAPESGRRLSLSYEQTF